ncbi:unnamed protein product [Rodentolepis nana]|uniref:ARID domain-containing protein n=1 Tax=Rodentolepis nana TaxID=102285 RepID=A0A0R3TS18_RODNA|nr:unnamed protein product [Rodentolepis nana]
MRVPEGVNVERLFAGLPRFLWCRLIQLLCLSDLGLVCAVLESLYTITGMGAIACTRLWGALASADDTVSPLSPSTVFAARRASSHLRPLIALLSLEGKDMGPESLHRVKVVPRHPNPPPIVKEPQFEQLYPTRYSLPLHHTAPSRFSSPYPTSHHFPTQRPQQQSPNPRLVTPQHIPPQPQSLASLLGPGGGGNSSSNSRISSGFGVNLPPRMATPPSLSPLPPQVANVRPKPSSLSELTDRLVMPPPKDLPPRRQSSRVNGSPGSPGGKPPFVNGRVPNTPPPNSLLNHHHQYNNPPNQVVSAPSLQKPTLTSTSLLEEALNNPGSSKVVPPKSPAPSPLLNGYSNRASTIHHTGVGRKSIPAVICNPPAVKMVNGEANNTTPTLPVIKNKGPEQNNLQEKLVNGVSHVCKPKNLKREYNEVKDDMEETETRLMEWATFNSHQLCYNRKVGFYFTRKRPRYFAARNRVFDQPKLAAGKRQKMMTTESGLKNFYQNVATAALLSKEQGKRTMTVNSNPNHRPSIPTPAAVQRNQPPSPPPLMFVCEWNGCFRQFPVASQVRLSSPFLTIKNVYSHAYSCHLKPLLPPKNMSKSPSNPSTPIERRCCLWSDCSTANISRAPYSLQSHVLDSHCSTAELESRRRLIPHRTAPYQQPASTPPVPPRYCPPDPSGWAIIQDVETRRMRSELWLSQYAVSGGRYPNGTPVAAPPRDMLPPREGPVTKHLRVTAALILRNLAQYVQEARQ